MVEEGGALMQDVIKELEINFFVRPMAGEKDAAKMDAANLLLEALVCVPAMVVEKDVP